MNKIKNINIISASAGSGKTYSLMKRLSLALTKENIKPTEVIAMTFTKDSAQELSERARKALIDEGLSMLALEIGAAKIGTIHGVCLQLLNDYAFEEGLSPRQNPMTEEDALVLFLQIVNNSLTNIDFAQISTIDNDYYDRDSSVKDDIKKLCNYIQSQNLSKETFEKSLKETLRLFSEIFPKKTERDLDNEIDKAYAKFQKNFTTPSPAKNAQAAFEKMNAIMREGAKNLSWKDWHSVSTLETGKKDEANYQEIKDVATDYLTHSRHQECYLKMINFVYSTAWKIQEHFKQKKKDLGLVDFTDMEVRLLKLLDNKTVQERFKNKYKLIMVDEFQDTSPLQMAIFLKMSSLCQQMVWVGDPKQSIYAFRGADPMLMNAILKLVDPKNIEYLDSSFRSREDLVNLTSNLFTEVLKQDGLSKKEVWLNPVSDIQKDFKKVNPVLIHWGLEGNKDQSYSQTASNTERFLAKFNKSFAPNDLAVLCPSNTNVSEISAYLTDLGFETGNSGGQLDSNLEVRLVISLYSEIIDSRNTQSALETLVLLGEDRETLINKLLNKETIVHPWSELVANLNKNLESLSPILLIEKILIEGNIYQFIETKDFPDKRKKNIRELKALFYEYEAFCFKLLLPCTFKGFLDFFTEKIENNDGKKPNEKMKYKNVIDVKTFHGAKGLEWSNVVLFDLDNPLNLYDGVFKFQCHFDEKSFDVSDCLKDRSVLWLKWPLGKIHLGSTALEDKVLSHPFHEKHIEEALKEKRRLLYVALTRAKESVIITTNKKTKKGDGYLALVEGLLELPEVTTYSEDLKYKFDLATHTVKDLPKLQIETNDLFVNPSLLEKSQTPFTAGEIHQYGTKVNIPEKLKEDNTRLGHFIHALLTFDELGIEQNSRLDFLQKIKLRWGIDERFEINDKQILEMSNGYQKLISGKFPNVKHFNEYSFEVELADQTIMRGSIDQLLVSDDEVIIIDHKTTDVGDAQVGFMVQKHSGQLEAYVNAARNIFGEKKKVRVFLNFPIVGKFVECKIS